MTTGVRAALRLVGLDGVAGTTYYRRIRADLGVARLKATTAGQLDLVALVDDSGGAPRVRGTTRVSGRLLGQGSPSVEPSSPRPPV
jgi:hypothetical protein